ncbi:MAG: chain length-determining protein [Gammaproteobacteria bacterium]|nr:chain length-determining protein [Gammaproteobacteria bacterium]
MQEIIAQGLVYVRGIWRHRWFLLLVAWLVCAAGWIIVYKMPDQYKASARVYVDTQSVLKPLLRGLTVETDVGQQVALMTRTLLSRPNLEKVARMTDLDLKAQQPEQMESLLEGLSKQITLEGTGRENLYTISYVNADPQLAKRVVQSLLTIFVENSLGESRKDSDSAQQFIDKQIQEYEQRLVEAEERLKEFKRKNVGIMPSRGEGYYESMQSEMAALDQARLELRQAENRRNEIKRQLEDEELNSESSAIVQPTLSTSAIDGRIRDLQSRMDSLLLQYTERHPDVIEIKRIMADLEKQKAQELKSMAKKGPQAETNPVYAQVKIALSQADANVAALRTSVAEHTRRIAQLKGMVDVIPQVETEMAQLNRDYEVNKQNYETLLARREAAKMSQQAGESADEVKFRVIDPPFVPTTPSGPNRPLLMGLVMLGGLAAGLVFAFLLSQLRPVFDDRRTLSEITGVPVLGSVAMVWTAAQTQKRRIELGSFALAGLALLTVFAGIETLQLLDIDVLGRIKNLVGS